MRIRITSTPEAWIQRSGMTDPPQSSSLPNNLNNIMRCLSRRFVNDLITPEIALLYLFTSSLRIISKNFHLTFFITFSSAFLKQQTAFTVRSKALLS